MTIVACLLMTKNIKEKKSEIDTSKIIKILKCEENEKNILKDISNKETRPKK